MKSLVDAAACFCSFSPHFSGCVLLVLLQSLSLSCRLAMDALPSFSLFCFCLAPEQFTILL